LIVKLLYAVNSSLTQIVVHSERTKNGCEHEGSVRRNAGVGVAQNPTVVIKTNPRFIARVLMADAIYTLALSALTGYD
jgi:hypothetical protein